MFIVVFGDDILNKMVFCLGNLSVRPFPYEHNKILQETDLLNVEFFPFDGKRIHCDRVFLGVTDVLAINVLAQSLIGVSCIDHHDVGSLFPHLSNHAVHVEGLATTAWPQTEKVGIIGNLVLSFFSADVDSYRYALSVCIEDFQGRVFTMLNMFLIHQTGSSIAKCEKTVIVRAHSVTVARE